MKFRKHINTFFLLDINRLMKAYRLLVLLLSFLNPLRIISQDCMQLTSFLGKSSNESRHERRENITSLWKATLQGPHRRAQLSDTNKSIFVYS